MGLQAGGLIGLLDCRIAGNEGGWEKCTRWAGMSAPFGSALGDASGEFWLAQFAGNGPADLFKAGEIPEIWEIPALLWFDRLHRAIVSRQKNALAVWVFLQGQSLAVMTQPREMLDEFIFGEALEGGEPGDFRLGQAHLSRPAAAGGATLTFKKNRHASRIIQPARHAKPRCRSGLEKIMLPNVEVPNGWTPTKRNGRIKSIHKMKTTPSPMLFAGTLGSLLATLFLPSQAGAGQTTNIATVAANATFTVTASGGSPLTHQWHYSQADTAPVAAFRGQFIQLCDLAAVNVREEHNKVPFFVDSYAVRALCAAYDLTGNTNYLDACRDWSERMVKYQEQMTPRGAYYMHYNRKPGETNGDWYAADSSSIGMAVLATAVRCQGAEQRRYLDSAGNFAELVMNHYVKPSGGVSDGLWSKSSDEWWCSSGLFGSFLFTLYASTGDQRHLKTALGITDWLDDWDLTKDQPFPLSQQGPAMLMYVMENYSAGWPYIAADETRKKSAQAKVSWCLGWIAERQRKPVADRPWPPSSGWGMKFGGLPFHQYIFARELPGHNDLFRSGDEELVRLAAMVFNGGPKATQLSMFMLMSYAERLAPGAIYKSLNRHPRGKLR